MKIGHALLITSLPMLFGIDARGSNGPTPGGGPVDISCRRELFIDGAMVDTLRGAARLELHHPVRRELVLVHDAPWEGNMCGYHSVLRDGDMYRLYYRPWHVPSDGAQGGRIRVAYAESSDGVHWTKPNLGIVEFEGSTENNLILDNIAGHKCHDFTPFIDGNPDCPAEHRYKAIGLGHGAEPPSLFGFVSADGVHWKPIQEEPVFVEEGWVFDTQNNAIWSETEGQYVLYYRKAADGVRNIARAVSDDFVNWRKEGLLDYRGRGPTKEEQFYTNQIRPYYRAPHIYIGFPARYVDRGWIEATRLLPSLDLREQRAQTSSRYGSAVTDALLIASRDGRSFLRHDEAFLRPGLRSRHNWAYGDNYIACHVVETQSGFDDQDAPELSLYATEGYFTGASDRVRRYTLRLDGFVSIHAPRDGGEAVSPPLVFDGSHLRLNVSTSAAGSVLVEIQDSDGTPVKGFTLDDCLEVFGDSVDFPVKWKDDPDLGRLAGRPVRLRFVLREADVYAFQFCR